jgi:DNA-damage-inducible protein D
MGDLTPFIPAQRDDNPFDAIKRSDEHGEYWSARELMPHLGYEQWRRFEDALDRAATAAKNTGLNPADHFAEVGKVIPGGRWGEQTVSDYRLTRYGAYLVAMNGDPRKPEIASAQTYFAVQTRQAEVGIPSQRKLSNRELAMMVIEAEDRADREAEARQLAESRVLELEPAAREFQRWQTSEDTVYVVEWAKSIGLASQQEGFEALRETGVLFKQQHEGTAFNVPKRGWEQYFVLVDEWLPGPKRWTKVPKITAEGQVVLAEHLLENGWISG